jgi:hypothetical protein
MPAPPPPTHTHRLRPSLMRLVPRQMGLKPTLNLNPKPQNLKPLLCLSAPLPPTG